MQDPTKAAVSRFTAPHQTSAVSQYTVPQHFSFADFLIYSEQGNGLPYNNLSVTFYSSTFCIYYNKLPNNIKQIENINQFKKKLKEFS
jgi:hypothetical protein